jgi:hypothetical protein
VRYFGFCDPSGGSHDSMCLAIARQSRDEKEPAIVCRTHERRAPFNPDVAVEECAGILRAYKLAVVVGDRYSAQWVVERFKAHGITYRASERSKSDIFLEFLSLANAGRIRIPNDKRLKTQLASLERRPTRGGRDVIDHPPAGADDLANVVAGALVLACAPRKKFFVPFTMDVLTPEPGAPFHDPHAGANLYDASVELPGEERFWRKQ